VWKSLLSHKPFIRGSIKSGIRLENNAAFPASAAPTAGQTGGWPPPTPADPFVVAVTSLPWSVMTTRVISNYKNNNKESIQSILIH
jgi:hypothetical protein